MKCGGKNLQPEKGNSVPILSLSLPPGNMNNVNTTAIDFQVKSPVMVTVGYQYIPDDTRIKAQLNELQQEQRPGKKGEPSPHANPFSSNHNRTLGLCATLAIIPSNIQGFTWSIMDKTQVIAIRKALYVFYFLSSPVCPIF